MQLTKEEILEKHLGGKLSVELKKKLENQKDLSIAYTPGVAKACLEIKDNPNSIFDYTIKKNSVAVVTDGTAVLGLGDIGPRASIPVMEGKAVLFKRFGKINSWPVPLENVRLENGKTDARKVIEAVKQIACLYGGINLEDIAAPACFEIEETLERELDIPVFHDDQWGTAIIVLAAVKNYCILSEKKIGELKIVVNGAGAAGIRICDMLKNAGVQNLFLVDSKGIVNNSRTDLNPYKQKHSRETNKKTLLEAIQNADVFIGVSVADCLTKEMVQAMNEFPAIFAMANPNPEITPEQVKEALGEKLYILATGRSDYPNQINNVLGFPYIFRGALDAKARNITMKMKIAASEALAELAREEFIPEEVKQAYGREFKFSKDYIIPTPFDPRLLEKVGGAVREAVED
jgi:malate dehydrogenase (oxaloacetate-decarboxylating)(NADP+)